jgi:hypothetical protein
LVRLLAPSRAAGVAQQTRVLGVISSCLDLVGHGFIPQVVVNTKS